MERQLAEVKPVDRRIAEIAARQHGLITYAQLTGLGMSRSGIARRVERGALYRVHRGVYAVRHPELTRHGEWLAAVLALGPGAALSHASAGVLWRLSPARGPRIDVTVPTSAGRARRRTIVVHRLQLEPEEVVMREAIPVTTAARTLTDLADVLTERRLQRALDEAHFLGLDLTGLAPRPSRRGSGRLSRVLSAHEPGSTWTRSELEERMLALCRRAGLPAPTVNTKVEGREADFHWPPQRLVLETDGWQSHRTPTAFENDRKRDAQLVEAGWRVVRVTRRRLAGEPDAVGAQLKRLLNPPGGVSGEKRRAIGA